MPRVSGDKNYNPREERMKLQKEAAEAAKKAIAAKLKVEKARARELRDRLKKSK